MKRIIKRGAPHALRAWFVGQPIQNGQRINSSYQDLPGDVKREIHKYLLDDQGWLCCYTGVRLDASTSHIEHFKPQCQCHDDEDVDYRNLFAAYPGDRMRCEFGALAKGDWYEEDLLVNPLHERCETQFRFDQFGGIRPAERSDRAANETIQRLRLDHFALTEMRRSAIEEALFPDREALSPAQLRRITRGYCRRDATRRFPRFCYVVAQVAGNVLQKAERERRWRKAVRRGSRK